MRMQNVARCHVRIVHPFESRHHVGPENLDDIKSILSSPLPILPDYTTHGDITGKALWRLSLEPSPLTRARDLFPRDACQLRWIARGDKTPLSCAGEHQPFS